MFNKYDWLSLGAFLTIAIYTYLTHNFWASFLAIQVMLVVALANVYTIRNRMK